MKNKKNNNDINIKTIWKILRSEKGKRYSFIIFYVFFFIFLFIFMNIDIKSNNKNNNQKNNQKLEETTMISSLPFDTNSLENNNYNFKYIVNCPSKITYDGIKNNNIYKFTNDETIEYELINGELNEDKKVMYVNFTNVYFLRQVLKNSKIISETKLNETNEYIYTYNINNNILGEFLKEENDSSDKTEIIVKTDSNKKIESISVDLSSYKNIDLCKIEYKLEIKS